MRQSFFSVIAVFLLFLPVEVFSADQPELKPRLSLPKPVFDFGTAVEGQKIQHDFLIKNTGTAALFLKRVVSMCGCVKVKSSVQKIEAGSEAQIQIELDSSGFRGAFEKTVRIYTSDRDTGYFHLTLKGVIAPEVEVNPSVLKWNLIKSKSGYSEQILSLSIPENSNVRLNGFRAFKRYTTTEVLNENEKEIRLNIILKDDLPEGDYRDRIIIRLKGASRKSINVPIVISIKPRLELRPEVISFGILTEETTAREVVLINHGKTPVQLQELECDTELLSCSYQEVKKGLEFKVSIKPVFSNIDSQLISSVVLRTDDSEYESLSAVVKGFLPPVQ